MSLSPPETTNLSRFTCDIVSGLKSIGFESLSPSKDAPLKSTCDTSSIIRVGPSPLFYGRSPSGKPLYTVMDACVYTKMRRHKQISDTLCVVGLLVSVGFGIALFTNFNPRLGFLHLVKRIHPS